MHLLPETLTCQPAGERVCILHFLLLSGLHRLDFSVVISKEHFILNNTSFLKS